MIEVQLCVILLRMVGAELGMVGVKLGDRPTRFRHSLSETESCHRYMKSITHSNQTSMQYTVYISYDYMQKCKEDICKEFKT